MAPGRMLAALALVAMLAPLALAQDTVPVTVDRVDEGALAADTDQAAVATFRLVNLNPSDDFFVRIQVKGSASWTTAVSQEEFFLEPRNSTFINVTFTPSKPPQVPENFDVVFNFVHGVTGTVTKVTERVEIASLAPPLVLDWFANPLPPPLDNAWGTFLLDMAFWIGFGIAGVVIGDALVRLVTARASNTVTAEILHKLRKPIFYFVFFLGLARSFAILPRNFFTDTLVKTFAAVAVGVFGLYVVYRVLDSILYYYQIELAPRTETTVDDLLVPVIRKVGIVVLYVIGVVVVLRNLGWDPTIIFAGAGIAGLVIAFAAQDTFSNLFSGIFLLLDRPFKEGDDIQLETGEYVTVKNIGLRTTRLYHPKTHELITLPNNMLATRRIINLSGPDQHYWAWVDVGVSYDADPRKVEEVLLTVARGNAKVMNEEGWLPVVRFKQFGESSLDFVLRFAVRDYRDRFGVASDLRFAIKAALDANDIEIPFPQRTLWVKEFPNEAARP